MLMASSIVCLALNIYWEARSEPIAGQLAVAEVTMNRTYSDRFPDDVCSVVKQSNSSGCQFSWYCDGKSDNPQDALAWSRAQHVARIYLTNSDIIDFVGEATFYHADYVTPYWAKTFKKERKIGRHIFYSIDS